MSCVQRKNKTTKNTTRKGNTIEIVKM